MIYLLLSILSSTVIFVVFRLYKKYGVNTLQAIIFNYFIACIVGFFGYIESIDDLVRIPSESWFLGIVFLGAMFITVFNLAAITTQRSGLSVVSVATKMSVAIPVFFGIFIYNESLGFLKITGIILALAAVYLSSIKTKKGISIKKENLIFPLLVFVGSGIIDTTINYLENFYVSETDVGLFSSSIFGIAGIIGTSILIGQAFLGKLKITWRNIAGGIALGIPNYFSIYFLVMALRSPGFENSVIFTLNHVGIVLASTVLGIVLFKEVLLKKNWIGIALAVISIILVASSQ
ncbi:EamA-like transporter family protein [Salegentibacter holothuriorum]|uniref:EamA-like transporter family protein n=1 Tax=Salegentibacter holothuriorum TaxID=241145 RepID=A0A1T5B1Q3_9FLAO|nr:EamA family transporter [Salegentibacter holothuriorum]SKB40803.1 EamA-like transporter family protein [Salegentibacter holothuriorum]